MTSLSRFAYAALLGFAALAGEAPAGAQDQGSPSACAASEFRQFDFWVGEWEVVPNGSSQPIATSRIESLYAGCAIRENWMPASGAPGGGSLNVYVASQGVWRQIWTDASGAWNAFEGGLADGSMILIGHRLSPRFRDRRVIARLTFTPRPDGSVRQLGEHSTDFGRSWETSYDFIYVRRQPDR